MIATREALARLRGMLAAAGVENPAREARLILAHAIGCDQAGLLTRDEVPEDAGLVLATRRAFREPLAHITGKREFWSLNLAVSPDTLIPRPDSETLIEAAISRRPDRAARRILDLGTGTGALLLAILTEFPKAFGIGLDLAPAAAALARANAHTLGLASRAAFFAGDWAAALEGRFDIVLANPPYIPHAEIAALEPEVAACEPQMALDGGADGFDAYRALIADLPRLLAPGGIAVFEAGIGQAEGIMRLADAQGLDAASHADLAGVPRAIVMSAAGSKPEKPFGVSDESDYLCDARSKSG